MFSLLFILFVKLNHKILIVFRKLKNYDLQLIMEELGKFDFKINVIANQLEKHMSFNVNNKLIFIDTFQFLSFLLNNVVNNLSKDRFKYLIQDFDSKVLVIFMSR